MTNKNATFKLNDQTLNFDFDEWVALHKQDPEAFEQRRIEWCNQLIQSAPPSCHRRLSGLLFQINMQKRQSANAMDSCLRISRLMWEKFYALRDELQMLMQMPIEPSMELAQQAAGGSQVIDPTYSAEIILFTKTTDVTSQGK